MDFFGFLNTGSQQHAAKALEKASAAKAARKAIHDLQLIENTRERYIDALNHDVWILMLAILQNEDEKLPLILNGAHTCLFFAIYVGISSGQDVEVNKLRSAISAIGVTQSNYKGLVNARTCLYIVESMIKAIELIRQATPIQILQACELFHIQQRELVLKATLPNSCFTQP